MPDGTVAGSWARIVAVLQERAPATARLVSGPADAATLGRLRSEIGLPLPPDLTEWLSLTDGATGHNAQIIPGFNAYGAEQIIAHNRIRHQVYGSATTPSGRPQQPAGTETGPLPEQTWLFIPVAGDGTGCDLVADLRDGDRRGCLMQWDYEGGPLHVRWPGVAVMLAEIAGALEHGRPEGREPTSEEITHQTRTGYLAVFAAGGTLDWHNYGGEQDRIRQREIRAWARSQGKLGERGRVAQSVVAEYERLHPR